MKPNDPELNDWMTFLTDINGYSGSVQIDVRPYFSDLGFGTSSAYENPVFIRDNKDDSWTLGSDGFVQLDTITLTEVPS